MSLSRKSHIECPLKENCPNALQVERLEKVIQRDGVFSRIDPDTGFYTSDFLLPALKLEITRAEVTGNTFSFLLVELTGFKNGFSGNGQPDPPDFMGRIARFMENHLRPIDLPFVLSSDEVGMIISCCAPSHALGLAKSWQEGMTSLFSRIKEDDFPEPQITIGVNGYSSATPFSGDELLIQTRRLLHELKKGSGRVGRVTSLHVSSPTEVTGEERSMLYGW